VECAGSGRERKWKVAGDGMDFQSGDTGLESGLDRLLEFVDTLMTAEQLLASNLPVCGTSFVDIFAGELTMTYGVMLTNVPGVKPWDSRYGEQFDVLESSPSRGGWVLHIWQLRASRCFGVDAHHTCCSIRKS
jgi:hypothetical protein